MFMQKKSIIVYCTVPSPELAEQIAVKLIQHKIAACCNIIPGLTSIYSWEGKIEKDSELLLMIKSTEENYKKIENEIINLHSYEVPEIISLEINEGSREYLNWIHQNTKVDYE